MKREHPILLSARRLPQNAKLHKILDEHTRCCGGCLANKAKDYRMWRVLPVS
jgi:hypothetical protein